MFRGILSVATDPVQQGNLTENPSLIITAVYGCYHEGKMSCSLLIFSLNKLDHISEAKIQKEQSTKAEDKVVAPAI